MTSFTHTHAALSANASKAAVGSTAVIVPAVVILTFILTFAVTLPSPLVLPALSLAATAAATVCAAVVWSSGAALKTRYLTSAGIFAIVAMAAAMLGDPDQVALFLK